MNLVSENIRFMQIFAGVPLGGGAKRHSTLCKKYAKMTATVIVYIRFSLYNCLEKTTQTVQKIWKTQGIPFCQICKHPDCLSTGRYLPCVVYCLLFCILQLNGSLSDPYQLNGIRSPICSSVSLSSKKHTDAHSGGVTQEFSRTPGKKADGNRNGKNTVVSLEDDFVSRLKQLYVCCIILQY